MLGSLLKQIVSATGRVPRGIWLELREQLSTHPDIFSGPHSAIAEICLTYLNCQQVKTISVATKDDLCTLTNNEPFLVYCSLYWGVHAKKELSDHAKSLALQLFREYDGHISVALLAVTSLCYPEGPYTGSLWSPLHSASYFGIVEVVTALVQMGCYGLSDRDYWGYTALAWAADMGHKEVVEILRGLEGVTPEPDECGGTLLLLSAVKGHAGVVKILLEREDVNPDKPNDRGRTPLSYAAQAGEEEVVKILLGREEVNLDKPDNRGRTPLWYTQCSQRARPMVGRPIGRGPG